MLLTCLCLLEIKINRLNNTIETAKIRSDTVESNLNDITDELASKKQENANQEMALLELQNQLGKYTKPPGNVFK